MSIHRSLLISALLAVAVATSAAQTPVVFQPDGKPDPDYPVPAELDLSYALSFALNNNYAIRQARESIKQQEGVVLEVSARRLPNVAASGNYTRYDQGLTTVFNPSDRDWALQVQATQVLYAGGGIVASSKSASLARVAAELELKGVINEQLLAVRMRFYNVLLAQQKITVQEENVELLGEQLENENNRFEAGTISKFEVLRAEVALANGQPALISARNDFRIAIEELRQVIGFTNVSGRNLQEVPNFVGDLTVNSRTDFDLLSSIRTARRERPEIQRLEKLEAAGEELVTVARAGGRPQVALIGGYQFAKGFNTKGWDNRREGWTAGLQGQWNIFDGHSVAGQVAQAKSLTRQTKLLIEESILAVDVEVRRSHSSLIEAWELVDASGKVVAQADEALRLAQVRYDAGTATQLDLLTSQVELTRAKLNQLQAYYRYNVALAAMHKAIGQADPYITG